MSQMRKKSFSFEEEELAWMNPLLVEWAKENEGKNQSDAREGLMNWLRKAEADARIKLEDIKAKRSQS